MLGRRIAARQLPPTFLPELRRTLLDEWCNILEDQINNLMLSMPRHYKACIACAKKARRSPASRARNEFKLALKTAHVSFLSHDRSLNL
ncbi:transposable element Tcb1 transposase [Trichonephila clavipes]|nr:transposable element Tcb1 transposase [Trichonephila clavipes]